MPGTKHRTEVEAAFKWDWGYQARTSAQGPAEDSRYAIADAAVLLHYDIA
ncbi:MAG: hypothetical protein ABSF50_09045 [Burkholderiaceae bacterium]